MPATERINIRTTSHAKALIKKASQRLGMSVDVFYCGVSVLNVFLKT